MSETELSAGYQRAAIGFTTTATRTASISTISTNNLEISNRSTRESLSPNHERRKLSLRSNKSKHRMSSTSNRSSRNSASGPDSPTKSEKSESTSHKSDATRRGRNSIPDTNYTNSRRPTTLKSSFLRRKIREYEGKYFPSLTKIVSLCKVL